MPLFAAQRGIFLVLLLGTVALLPAQVPLSLVVLGTSDSIVVAGRSGGEGEMPAFHADWVHVDGKAARFNFRPAGGVPGSTSLNELIVAGVGQYLDQRVHFTREGVDTDLPLPLLCAGIDKMISLAAARFGVPVLALSTATRDQLGRITKIDWSQATFGVDGGEDQEKYLAIYYYVRAQRQELERQLRNDLIGYAATPVMPAGDEAADQAGSAVAAPTVCSTVFDDENFLCALDLRVDGTLAVQDVQLTDAMLSDIAAKAESMRTETPTPKLRKRDRWLKAELDAINKRLDQVDQRKELWALRDRMDDMEDRITNIDMQVDELRLEQKDDRETGNPLEDLSQMTGKDLAVHFAVGTAGLDSKAQALLDEVVRVMGRNPESRLLVTGRTDRSGDPARNLLLSERRAKSVRSYLLNHGIAAERVLLNYFGGRKSTGTAAGERRVDLEWVR